MNSNESHLTAEAKRIAGIAENTQRVIGAFQKKLLISEADAAMLHDAEEFFEEVISGVEAVDAFNRHHKLTLFWNLSSLHELDAAIWYLSLRKLGECRPSAVHEIVHEVRTWNAVLRKMEFSEDLERDEKRAFEELWQFLGETISLAERIAGGEPLPAIALEPVAQEET